MPDAVNPGGAALPLDEQRLERLLSGLLRVEGCGAEVVPVSEIARGGEVLHGFCHPPLGLRPHGRRTRRVGIRVAVGVSRHRVRSNAKKLVRALLYRVHWLQPLRAEAG